MDDGPDRARPWWRHEGTVTTAVLTLAFLALLGWGVGDGWGTGSLVVPATGALLMGAMTVRGGRRSTKR